MDLLTPAEAAKRLRVSPITLRKWADSGLIVATVTAGGHRRYPAAEVERMLRNGTRKERATKVMIVDDDALMIELVRDFLLESGRSLDIEVANDGFDAGRKLVAFEPDVMLLDLMMPGLDGFEVCRRVKAMPATKSTRVLAMTGYPTADNIARILAEGAEICLTKPMDRDALLAAIDRTHSPRNAAPLAD